MAHKKLVRPKCGCKLRDTGADVSFSHLGDGADGSEEHPIVLTEAPCNLLHSRQMMLDACERGQEPGGVLPPASAPAEVHWSPGGRHPLPHREMLHKHSYTANDYHKELEKWRSAEFYEQEMHRM
ncbi:actin-related protein 5-like [Oncorhynchus kisutch]|uniref:actin-related protein 5-like n=1 Tax=Oncorhynchus kisutch TaxID=8019 RepID=UPI0009A04413|nr:actin-related protein 5-like [Oncorhynchus kisutch]